MTNILRPRVDVTETIQQLVTPGANPITIGIVAHANSTVGVDEFVSFSSAQDIVEYYGANVENTTRGNVLYDLASIAFREGASIVKLCNLGAAPAADPIKEVLGAVANAGDLSVTVADATDYAAGDIIYIGTGEKGFLYEEKREVVTATGTTLTFTPGLQFSHPVTEEVAAIAEPVAGDFTAALTALATDRDIQIFIAATDSPSIQSTIKTTILAANTDENFMVYLAGLAITEASSDAITQAEALNDTLCGLVWPNVTDTVGKSRQGFETAAYVAGALTRRGIPSVNFNLLELQTATGVVANISNIDALISAGVAPIELRDNEVRVVRAVNTYSDDDLEEELSVRLNVNHIKRTIQRTLEKTYLTSGNTLITREAIKSTITDLLRQFNDSGILATDERTGTPGYKAPIVQTNALNAKQIDITLEITPTQPLVWMTLNFKINL